MTINAASPSTSPVYFGDGVSTVFGFPFPVDGAGDIQVRVNGAVVPPGRYTVNVSGRAVTLTTPLAVGSTLIVVDYPVLSQPRDYTNQGGVPADDVERALDKLTRIVRALARDKLDLRPGLPLHVDNTAARAAGRTAGELYATPSGAVRVVL